MVIIYSTSTSSVQKRDDSYINSSYMYYAILIMYTTLHIFLFSDQFYFLFLLPFPRFSNTQTGTVHVFNWKQK